MTTRRRFFPAAPVQQVPGKTVEMAMQLRKDGPAATGCACQDVYATWLTSPDVWSYDLIEEAAGPGQTRVRLIGSRWDDDIGAPVDVEAASFVYIGDYSAVPVENEGTEWEKRIPDLMAAGIVRDIIADADVAPIGSGEAAGRYRAMFSGKTLCDPQWAITWSDANPDDPMASGLGDEVITRGPILELWVNRWGEFAGVCTLTANAMCGGAIVDTLTFEIRHRG